MDCYKVETWNNYQSSSPNMVSAVTQFPTHNATVCRMRGGGGEKEVVWSRKPIFSWSNNTKVNFGCTGNFLGQLPHRSQGSRGVVQGKVLPWIQSWHEPWIFLGWWKLDFKVRVKAFTTLARPPIWLPCTGTKRQGWDRSLPLSIIYFSSICPSPILAHILSFSPICLLTYRVSWLKEIPWQSFLTVQWLRRQRILSDLAYSTSLTK